MVKFCVVGSGPSAFYATKFLLRKLPHAEIDMIEKLLVPFGLVRFGVAPDHPEVKNVINDFEKVASHPNFKFYGNVCLGKDVTIDQLRKNYDGTILAYGASNEKHLGIPGENLRGVISSNKFVSWYNGHPNIPNNFSDQFDDINSTHTACIIGNGNVALDCARILTKSREELFKTDIINSAYNCINKMDIHYVNIYGRRNWPQASFTNKELRELVVDDSILPILNPDEYKKSLDDINFNELKKSRPIMRAQPLYETMAKNWDERSTTLKNIIHFSFLKSPIEFLPLKDDPHTLGSIKLNEMILEHSHTQPQAKPNCTPPIVAPSRLAITSVGYQIEFQPGLPVSNNKLIHQNGRIYIPQEENGGLYAVGWLKRGPSGNIASNIMDAQETVQQIVSDTKGLNTKSKHTNLFKQNHISFKDWLKVKDEEAKRGYNSGKLATKLSDNEISKLLNTPH